MRRTTLSLRTGLLLAGLLAGLLATPGAATASHPQRLQPFFVTADDCHLGYTEGTLSWRAVHPPEPVRLDVRGAVYDRYRYEGGGCSFFCAPEVCDDGLATTAYFTAYVGDVAVDRERRTVDNGALRFSFSLGDEPPQTIAPIDRVVIQVCRFPADGSGAAGFCGKPQAFHP